MRGILMPADEVVTKETPLAIRDRQLLSEGIVYWLMGLLVIYVIVRGVLQAATKSFFFDELITMAVASQPGLRGIWAALVRIADAQPPLFYWCERVAISLVSNKHIALRLPSILAMPWTLICLFLYVKKRSGEFVALLCALLLLLTSIHLTYSTDARPYEMVIACVAFALICYQRLPSSRWAALLGFSLALAQALSYYAIFAMIPFGLAETVVLMRTKRIRWHVWLALLFGALPLLMFWPLLWRIRAYYGAHFWSRYDLQSLPKTYGGFFFTNAAFGTAILAVSIAGVIGARLLAPRTISGEKARGKSDPIEGTLLLALLALPVIAFAITKFLHGGMADRYVLVTAIGITLAAACVLSFAGEKGVVLFALFVVSSVVIHEISFWKSVHSFHPENPATPIEKLVEKAGYVELPVVVSDGLTYLQVAYYTSPGRAARFVFLADEQKAVEYLGTDTVDKNIRMISPYTPLHVTDFSEFTSSHAEFLLYADDPGPGFDWLPYHLSREPWSLQVLAMEQSRRLYLVSRNERAAAREGLPGGYLFIEKLKRREN